MKNLLVNTPRRLGAAALLACLSVVPWSSRQVRAADVALRETGSTLLLPLLTLWVAEYTKTHLGVKISLGGTGSEAGIKQALSGIVEIGASDAYMSDHQIHDNPDVLNIAMAIGAQTINYNLPGLAAPNLKLDGQSSPAPTPARSMTGMPSRSPR